MYTVDEAKTLLDASGVFFEYDEDEDGPDWKRVLNMNDVWGWACADGEYVSDDQLIEVATLFYRYGWCGILYWVSQQNYGCRSEFYHYNRMIDFVANEERIRAELPDETRRAYSRTQYTIGEQA